MGYSAKHLELNSTKMDDVVRKRAKSDHADAMKRIPAEERTLFDPSELPSATPGQIFYCGWLVAGIPTSKKMLEEGVLTKVIISDFAHAKKQAVGSYAFAVGLDANGHIVPFAAMHTILPESTDTWTELVKPMKVCAPHCTLNVRC
jgi:hypothetical protein